MKKQRCLVAVITILLLGLTTAWAHPGKTQLKVMTRNLYLGADIFKVVEAAQQGPSAVPLAVADVFQTVQETDFAQRAEAIADEIDRYRPDVIGLQEVETYYLQSPGDFLMGNPVQANDVVIDFYATLNAALKARCLKYQAFSITNADVELPMATPTGLDDVRMVDHDYILVRKGLTAGNLLAANYTNNVGLDIAGNYIEFTRGYLAVDVAKKRGPVFRVVSTHLEVRGPSESIFSVVQAAQMQELLTILSGEDKPIVMLGDYNSSPEDPIFVDPEYGPIVPPYMQATQYAGYLDAWTLKHHPEEGLTCCFDEYVSDPDAELYERIDMVFLAPKDLTLGKVKATLVGDSEFDMTPGGLWPSDHAGVVAMIKFGLPMP